MSKLSLHRVIAEIKHLEEKMKVAQAVVGVATKKDGIVGTVSKEVFESQSQGIVDQFVANLDRLRKLKAARNIANATTKIAINGREMTIDEAIIHKVTAEYIRVFVNSIKHQINTATTVVNQASQEVEKKIESQVAVIGGSTKKISDEELKSIRVLFERSTGKEIVLGKNVENFVKTASDELEKFLVEVDYALSEINASTYVEV